MRGARGPSLILQFFFYTTPHVALFSAIPLTLYLHHSPYAPPQFSLSFPLPFAALSSYSLHSLCPSHFFSLSLILVYRPFVLCLFSLLPFSVLLCSFFIYPSSLPSSSKIYNIFPFPPLFPFLHTYLHQMLPRFLCPSTYSTLPLFFLLPVSPFSHLTSQFEPLSFSLPSSCPLSILALSKLSPPCTIYSILTFTLSQIFLATAPQYPSSLSLLSLLCLPPSVSSPISPTSLFHYKNLSSASLISNLLLSLSLYFLPTFSRPFTLSPFSNFSSSYRLPT